MKMWIKRLVILVILISLIVLLVGCSSLEPTLKYQGVLIDVEYSGSWKKNITLTFEDGYVFFTSPAEIRTLSDLYIGKKYEIYYTNAENGYGWYKWDILLAQ